MAAKAAWRGREFAQDVNQLAIRERAAFVDMGSRASSPSPRMWKPISAAPFNVDLELAVLSWDGPHVLVFPCHRVLEGWISTETRQPIDMWPTHWREWQEPA
jgi:hypothetical protein